MLTLTLLQSLALTWVTQTQDLHAKPKAVMHLAQIDSDIETELKKRQGKFSFEFSKAEIMDVVKAISNITQQNFVIPEGLKSQRITILSPTKITAAEAYHVFYTALASNGITLVKAGKFYKLVNSKDSSKDLIPTCVGPNESCEAPQEQMVATLIHLRYTDASSIVSVIKSLMSKDGDVAVFQPTNALLMSEYAPNLQRIQKIIDSLDVPGFDDELQLVRIQYAGAQEIADKLTQIFDINSNNNRNGGIQNRMRRAENGNPDGGGGGNEDADVQISKIVADERTNQIIIKAHRRSFEAIKHIISKLDVPISDTEQGRVHVYYLENASAEELASTLSSLAQSQTQRESTARAAAARENNPNITAHAGTDSAVLFEGEVKVTADKSTNSLIIMANGNDFRSLRTLIEQLDVPRRQVYVEAAILEVTVNNDQNTGVSWHAPVKVGANDLGGALGSGSFGFLQSAQGSSGISPTLTAFSSPASFLQVAGGSVADILGKSTNVAIGNTSVSLPSFGVILKWLQSSSSANILSTPHLLTTDNEEASIEIGSKIPFVNGTSIPMGGLGNLSSSIAGSGTTGATSALSGLGGFGNLFSSTQRIDVSLKLTITPQINEHNKIKLNIEQKIEDVTGQDERTQQPITSNRSAKTVVVVEDQQTIVIGGLMRNRTSKSDSKLPILGDIPILGWLFRQHSTKSEKVNLLLVLTPYIVTDSSDFQRIFERKMREHEEFSEDYYGKRSEFRAHIDYARKTGPFAYLAAAVQAEKSRYENGGKGNATDTIIQPTPNQQNKAPEKPVTVPQSQIIPLQTSEPVTNAAPTTQNTTNTEPMLETSVTSTTPVRIHEEQATTEDLSKTSSEKP